MNVAASLELLGDLEREPDEYRPETTVRLLEELGDPQEDLELLRVAGSGVAEGVVRAAASVLEVQGLSVGRFTLPRDGRFTAHVSVEGRAVRRTVLADRLATIAETVVELRAAGEVPSLSEVLLPLALAEFCDRGVDVAVLEGRLDPAAPTAAVDAAATAAPSLSSDREAGSLADYLAALDDDGVLVARPEIATVQSEGWDGRLPSVGADGGLEASHEFRSPVESVVRTIWSGTEVTARVPVLDPSLAAIAEFGLELAGAVTDPDAAAVKRSLQGARWPMRAEAIQQSPTVLLDDAGGASAPERLAEVLASLDYDDLLLVCGTERPAAAGELAERLPPARRAYACRPGTAAAEPTEAVATALERAGSDAVSERVTVDAAVEAALENAGDDDLVLVTGSAATAQAARRRWSRVVVPTGRHRSEVPRLTLETRLLQSTADVVERACLAAGGECSRSRGSARHREPVLVTLEGEAATFDDLAGRLRERGLPSLAGAVETRLRERREGVDRTPDWVVDPDRNDADPVVMGILNHSVESFYTDSIYEDVEESVEEAKSMIEQGADVIDVGGESKRPGADVIDPEEEIRRIVPFVERISELDATISVDTWKADVAEAALDAGADIINDVSGLADPQMRHVLAEYDAPLVLMHSINAIIDPDGETAYDHLVLDIAEALQEPILRAEQVGVDREDVVVDPGLGFGKTNPQNYELLDRAAEFEALGCPTFIGHSRKSMFQTMDRDFDNQRHGEIANTSLPGTLATTGTVAERDVDVVRVHDVMENVQALEAVEKLR